MSLPCKTAQNVYDGDGLTTDDYNTATSTRGRSVALMVLEDTVDAALAAISACQVCPILGQCRKMVVEAQQNQIGPAGVIQAGVYWGLNGKPDFSLGGCLDKTSADNIENTSLLPATIEGRTTRIDETGNEWPLTVPLYRSRENDAEVLTAYGPISRPNAGGWQVSWIAPTPRINEVAVSTVCRSTKEVAAVPASKLSGQHTPVPAGAEVLSDADVCEVVRRLSEKKISQRSIARKLSLSSATVRHLQERLGIKGANSPTRQAAALKREARRREQRRALQNRTQPALF